MSSSFPFELGRFFRVSDPSTSREAAQESLPSWRAKAMQVLPAFADAELNAWEACVRSGLTNLGVCPWHRVSDLKQLGLIEPTGQKREGNTKSKQMVLRITDKGRAVLAQMNRRAA